MKKKLLLATAAIYLASILVPLTIKADVAPQATLAQSNVIPKPLYMRITAYSSSPDETDDTPFITAAGTRVRDGIVATNALPFGTKIKIPELFGEKTFTVEDRMHRRMKNVVDIWMSSKTKALRFGVSYAEVTIVEPRVVAER
jgi:3D (Asp-Asp-Asp) domain-containing protein